MSDIGIASANRTESGVQLAPASGYVALLKPRVMSLVVFTGLVGGCLRREGQRAAALGFTGFAMLLAFLAFDEVVMVHEWAAEKMLERGVPKLLGIDHDVYVFLGYGAVAGLCGIFMLKTVLRHRDALPMLFWMVLFAVGSEAADFVPWDSLSDSQKAWVGPIEEGTKTMATLCAVLYSHALLGEMRQDATAVSHRDTEASAA